MVQSKYLIYYRVAQHYYQCSPLERKNQVIIIKV